MPRRRKYNRKSKAPNIDRISNLPVDIIHQIISSLSIKDATRTSVLSKRWRSIWDSRPYIHFDESLFCFRHDAFRTCLFKFLDTRGKQCENNSCVVDKLFLHMKVEDIAEYLVKQLIEYALKNKVKALDLGLPMSFGKHYYVLVAANLIELKLRGCQIANCSFVLPSLKSLSLLYLDIDKLFADLIDGCPQIEELNISKCCIKCCSFVLPSLKSLSLEEVDIDGDELFADLIAGCPQIESLKIQECEITDCSFVLPSLKSLSLRTVAIGDKDLADLIDGCPQIEWLSIEDSSSTVVVSNSSLKFFRMECYGGHQYCKIQVKSPNLESFELLSCIWEQESHLQISSTTTVKNLILRPMAFHQNVSLAQFIGQFSQLENLVIYYWSDSTEIEEITIHAPKLKSFKFIGARTSFPGIKASKELEFVNFNLKDLINDKYDSLWYIWLRDSLESFAHVKHLMLKCRDEKAIMFPDNLAKKLLPIYNIKHLELKIKRPSATTQEILDGFIWILPTLKTLKLTLGSNSELIEFPQRE